MIFENQLFDIVIFDELLDQTPKAGSFQDGIPFTDTMRASHQFATASDQVIFIDVFTKIGSCTFNVDLDDSFVFTDTTHWRTHIEGLTDPLFLLDWFVAIKANDLDDTLVFVDEMVGLSGVALIDTLTFEDSIPFQYTLGQTITDSLTLSDGFTIYFNDPWTPVFPIVEQT